MTGDPNAEAKQRLLTEIDRLTAATGFGLFIARHYVNTGDLQRARQRIARIRTIAGT